MSPMSGQPTITEIKNAEPYAPLVKNPSTKLSSPRPVNSASAAATSVPTSPAMAEAEGLLEERGVAVDLCRLRGYPFADEVATFIAAHEQVFVVEQNRDAQMRTLLVNELGVDPARLVPVLHYDGTPITARFIAGEIGSRADGGNVTPIDRRARVA